MKQDLTPPSHDSSCSLFAKEANLAVIMPGIGSISKKAGADVPGVQPRQRRPLDCFHSFEIFIRTEMGELVYPVEELLRIDQIPVCTIAKSLPVLVTKCQQFFPIQEDFEVQHEVLDLGFCYTCFFK